MDLFKIVPIIKTVYKLTGSLIGVNRQDDVAVFKRLDAVLDEQRLSSILNYRFFTESLRCDERDLLYEFAGALQHVENSYQHPVVARRARQLTSELSRLLQTVDTTFSSDDGELFRFSPDPKDPTAYDREWDNLHDGIEKTWKAYKTYRQVVSDRLKV